MLKELSHLSIVLNLLGKKKKKKLEKSILLYSYHDTYNHINTTGMKQRARASWFIILQPHRARRTHSEGTGLRVQEPIKPIR